MVRLTQEDYDQLVAILEDMPEWHTEQGRFDLLNDAFATSPRKGDVIRVQLGGNTRQSAGRVITHLAQFGQDTPRREALFAFTGRLRKYFGEGTNSIFLLDLPQRYSETPLEQDPVADTDTNCPGRATKDHRPGSKEQLIGMRDHIRDLYYGVVRTPTTCRGIDLALMAQQLAHESNNIEVLLQSRDQIRELCAALENLVFQIESVDDTDETYGEKMLLTDQVRNAQRTCRHVDGLLTERIVPSSGGPGAPPIDTGLSRSFQVLGRDIPRILDSLAALTSVPNHYEG